jgi:hypothetical protein
MMTALRLLNLIIWGGLWVYMVPGAWSAVRGKEIRRGDPMRLGVAAVCVVMILGNLRWLFAPDSDSLFASIYALSAMVGIYIIRLAKAYGRGPKL